MKKTLLSFAVIGAVVLGACSGDKKDENNEEKESKNKTEKQEKKEEVDAEPVTFTIDTASSVIEWNGFKTERPDDGHEGTLMVESGEIVLKGEFVESASFVIDMTTIEEKDPSSEKMAKKLEGHLASPDFFNVPEHQTATVTINSVEDGVASGSLNVSGVEIPLAVPVSVSTENGTVTVSANFEANLEPLNAPGFSVPEDKPEEAISPVVKLNATIVANK